MPYRVANELADIVAGFDALVHDLASRDETTLDLSDTADYSPRFWRHAVMTAHYQHQLPVHGGPTKGGTDE